MPNLTMPTITPQRFETGMTYTQYKAQMTTNQDRLLATEEATDLAPSDLAWLTDLTQPLNLLVLTEDWCGDAIAALPVLSRLADASEQIALRIFLRDQNLDIMDQYLKEGKYRSIPVVVLFDQAFNEFGHLIERPNSVTEKIEAVRREIFEADPLFADLAPDTEFGDLPDAARKRLLEAVGEFRQTNRAFCDAEWVREIGTVLKK